VNTPLIVKVRIEVDGALKYEHPNFERLQEIEVGPEAAKYDLEDYFLPPVLRRIIKTSKPLEVFQVRCTSKARLAKIVPYFDDPQGIFTKANLGSFEKEVVFTICLVAFEQKDYVFKIPIAEKLSRLTGFKALANEFMK
jgi:hypothetical protein